MKDMTVTYQDKEYKIIDDRIKDSFLISRENIVIRVKKSQVLTSEEKNKIREIVNANANLENPINLFFLFGKLQVPELNDDQMEALKRFIFLNQEKEQKNSVLSKKHQKAAKQCYCLSIKQPWADAIFNGCKILSRHAQAKFKKPVGSLTFKDIENRTWRLPSEHAINRRIYIHTSKQYCKDGETWMLENGLEPVTKSQVDLGKIIGSVIFLGDITRPARPWSIANQWHWEIYKPLLLPKPIPYPGKLKFYQIDRDEIGLPSYDEERLQTRSDNA